VDQYESNVCGHLPTSQGTKSPTSKYCGGTLFFDVATQYVQIYYQVLLGSSYMLNSKLQFEKEAAHCDITVDAYHNNNSEIL